MKKIIKYQEAPTEIAEAITAAETIADFLPSPENLIKKEETIKVTISLSKESIDFFKQKARELGVPYQTMIKTIIDKYTMYYQSKKE